MKHIKNKKGLYKLIVIICSISFMSLLLVSMLYFYYETIRIPINNFINFVYGIFNEVAYYLNKIYKFTKNSYLELNKTFNNRELAIGFWISVFIVYALSVRNVRRQLPDTIKILFSKKLVIWYIFMLVYFSLMIFVLVRVGIWDKSLLKNAIIWFITVGIISSGKAIGKAKDLKYFIDSIKDNIKLLIIVQFISNLYCFSFIKEVILVLVIVFVSMLIAVMDVETKYKDKNSQILRNILNVILAAIGFYILYHSISLLVVNIHTIEAKKLIKDMTFPTILSIMFIFFTYFFVIYAAYEQLFLRLSFKKTIDDNIRIYLRIRILLFCNINIIRINNFIFRSQIMNSYVTSKGDIKILLSNYKANLKPTAPSIT